MYVQHVRIMTSYARVRGIESMDFLSTNITSSWGTFRTKRMLRAMTNEGILKANKDLVSRAQFEDHWTRSLGEGNPYFFIALFIARLHNLHSLRLDYILARDYGFLAEMLMHVLFSTPANRLSSFEKLTVVEYGGYLTPNFSIQKQGGAALYLRPEITPRPSLAWFMLPSLRTLEARVGDQELQKLLTMIRRPIGRVHNLSHLERLVLHSCSAKEHRTAELLSLTPSLTSLHLGLSAWFLSVGEVDCMPLEDGSMLLRSLVGLRRTLKHLSIGLNLFSSQITEPSDLRPCLVPFDGFFKIFPTLQTAEIQVTMLLGIYDKNHPANLAQLLPPELHSLCIRCYLHPYLDLDLGWTFPRIMRCIREFLPHLKTSTPKLTRIYVHADTPFLLNLKHEAEISRVCDSVRELGLDLSVRVLKPCVLPGLWTRRRDGDDGKFVF